MKISLCLAGGGIKGLAHVGVLKALEEKNIEIEYIGGASSGSIVSILYASGFTSDEIYQIFKKYCKEIKYIEFTNLVKMILGIIIQRKIVINGLNSGKVIEKLINKKCNEKGIYKISDIKNPVAITSVNMKTGDVICFSSFAKRSVYSDNIKYIQDAEVGKAVRASCSYPVVFSPCQFKNMELIDGGIRENVPWKELKMLGADNILNVVFEGKKDDSCCDNFIEVAGKSIDLLCRELSVYEMEGADMIMKIKTKKVGLLDIRQLDYLYEQGYSQAKKYIETNF